MTSFEESLKAEEQRVRQGLESWRRNVAAQERREDRNGLIRLIAYSIVIVGVAAWCVLLILR